MMNTYTKIFMIKKEFKTVSQNETLKPFMFVYGKIKTSFELDNR